MKFPIQWWIVKQQILTRGILCRSVDGGVVNSQHFER